MASKARALLLAKMGLLKKHLSQMENLSFEDPFSKLLPNCSRSLCPLLAIPPWNVGSIPLCGLTLQLSIHTKSRGPAGVYDFGAHAVERLTCHVVGHMHTHTREQGVQNPETHPLLLKLDTHRYYGVRLRFDLFSRMRFSVILVSWLWLPNKKLNKRNA